MSFDRFTRNSWYVAALIIVVFWVTQPQLNATRSCEDGWQPWAHAPEWCEHFNEVNHD